MFWVLKFLYVIIHLILMGVLLWGYMGGKEQRRLRNRLELKKFKRLHNQIKKNLQKKKEKEMKNL